MLEYLGDELYDIYNEYPNLFPVQTTTDYALAVGEEDITNGAGIGEGFTQGVTVENLTAGFTRNIPVVDFRWVQETYPDANNTSVNPAGAPRFVYWLDGTINVYPVPDKEYNLRVTHYVEPGEIASGDDIPSLPMRFRELAILGMSYRALQEKDNYDQAAILQNKRDEILQKFVAAVVRPFVGHSKIMRINRRAVGKKNF